MLFLILCFLILRVLRFLIEFKLYILLYFSRHLRSTYDCRHVHRPIRRIRQTLTITITTIIIANNSVVVALFTVCHHRWPRRSTISTRFWARRPRVRRLTHHHLWRPFSLRQVCRTTITSSCSVTAEAAAILPVPTVTIIVVLRQSRQPFRPPLPHRRRPRCCRRRHRPRCHQVLLIFRHSSSSNNNNITSITIIIRSIITRTSIIIIWRHRSKAFCINRQNYHQAATAVALQAAPPIDPLRRPTEGCEAKTKSVARYTAWTRRRSGARNASGRRRAPDSVIKKEADINQPKNIWICWRKAYCGIFWGKKVWWRKMMMMMRKTIKLEVDELNCRSRVLW